MATPRSNRSFAPGPQVLFFSGMTDRAFAMTRSSFRYDLAELFDLESNQGYQDSVRGARLTHCTT